MPVFIRMIDRARMPTPLASIMPGCGRDNGHKAKVKGFLGPNNLSQRCTLKGTSVVLLLRDNSSNRVPLDTGQFARCGSRLGTYFWLSSILLADSEQNRIKCSKTTRKLDASMKKSLAIDNRAIQCKS